MCGIAGKIHRDADRQVDPDLLASMTAAIVHRGPDDEGSYLDGPVGLGMRRLKVIDLEGGSQPMSNEDGSIWIVFNGEIYNHRELRSDLEGRGHQFRTDSDTEAIIHLYEEEGLACFLQLRGMFAVALWDKPKQRLMLARDRLGKKPLYYSQHSAGLSFASEMAAIVKDADVERTLDYRAIDEYLMYLFVPHPLTPFMAVRKLPPGSYAVYSEGELAVTRYWEVEYDSANTSPINDNVDAVESLLLDSVETRLQADVPLGSFLSGGLDSSLVTAMMCKLSGGPVATYSIGFEDSSFSELDHARTVATYLGTTHEERVVSYGVKELFPKLLDHFGEPYADSSAIPTYHLSELTRQGVTVALSGDGGDEVFGGYRRYQAGLLSQVYNCWPSKLGRGLFEQVVSRIPEPASYYGDSVRKKLRRFLEFAASVREKRETSWAFFHSADERSSLYSREFTATLNRADGGSSFAAYVRKMPGGTDGPMFLDLLTYLPDDILTKVDRMSMVSSLEVRCPLLDQNVVEFMARVPRSQKFNVRESKLILRRVAARYLPESILRRPKHGFAVPLAHWLKSDLKSWAQDLLLSSSFKDRGLFAMDRVHGMLDSHFRGSRDYSQQIWSLMVLEMWFQRNLQR